MKKTALLAVIGMIFCATVASAANREGQFSISPVVGGYTYDTRQHLDTNLIYGLRAGYNFTKHVGIEALFDYVNTDAKNSSKDVNMYRYGGELLYHFFPDNRFVPYLAAGFGGIDFNNVVPKSESHGVFDYGIGAKYFLSEAFALRADIRHLITTASRPKNNVEYTVGAYIPFGGVMPAAKPVEPPPAPAAVAAVAVPATVAAAPTANLTAFPATITKGQTATLNWKSKNATSCEILPGIGAVPPNGARTVSPEKNTAYTLSCAGAGGTATSDAGVAVIVPEPAAAPVAEKVKETPAAARFCNKPAILKINFDTDKFDIKPRYYDELKTVGNFLKEFPNARGEISGHTDSIASDAYNQKLSERRAESVWKYISTTFGIDKTRITTKGFGEKKPVASNMTKEGRAQNRRIEANFECK